jgi:hypothetical protein
MISVENFVKALYPSPAHTYKQVMPLMPEGPTFCIRLLTDSRDTETTYHMLVERDFNVIYAGSTPADVMTKMDALSNAFMDGTVIAINASARYIRVEAFSYSAPFETENDKFAAIGVLQTSIREARTQTVSPFIAEVNTTI